MFGVQNGNSKRYLEMSLDENMDGDTTSLVAETPWETLNNLLDGGWRGGETTGILAPSGMGKTTLVNQVAVFAALNRNMTGLISLEGTRDSLKRKLKDIIKGLAEPEQYQTVLDNLVISKLEGTKVGWRECVTEYQGMIASGCKLLILDNLDFITRDNHGEKLNAYAELIDLARANDVHVIVVWQPNKIDRDKVVNSGNQKGYSQFLQDADNYLNLNRQGDFIRLEVEKTREKGVDHIARHVWFVYFKDKRRFDECGRDVVMNRGTTEGQVLPLSLVK
jgi:hypothetical protein